MLAPLDVLKLARLFGAAEGIAVSTVGKRAIGNHKIFKRIAEGASANARTLQMLETFFRATWPDNAPWPSDIKPGLELRRQPRPAACTTAEDAP